MSRSGVEPAVRPSPLSSGSDQDCRTGFLYLNPSMYSGVGGGCSPDQPCHHGRRGRKWLHAFFRGDAGPTRIDDVLVVQFLGVVYVLVSLNLLTSRTLLLERAHWFKQPENL
jgi:hypothetical protein